MSLADLANGGIRLSAAVVHIAPEVWEATLGQLMLRVTRQNYDNWLRSTAGQRFDGTTLVVGVPNEFAAEWLTTRMRAVISQALTSVAGPGLALRYEVAASEPAPASHGYAPLQPSLLPAGVTPLNPRFTFASFLAGEHNRLALSAALDVVANADTPYSPLLITGGSGSGKTHLLHALGHEALCQGLRFLLVNAEEFLSDFTTSIRNKTGAAFRARYREPDLLLVDDVQRLTDKKATQGEFYQTIACLHDAGRRVVLTCDRSTAACEAAVRFQTELHWGLLAHIESPAVEDRVRFLQVKSAGQQTTLPTEVLHYVALRVKSSMRDLEGALNRIMALARISDQPVTIDFAAQALQPISPTAPQDTPAPEPRNLLRAVCRHLAVAPEGVVSQRRDRTLTYARHIAMYLLREDAGLTYSAIAKVMGKKDHSTVVHACSQLQKQLNLSPPLRADIDAIRADIIASHPAA